MYFLLFLIHIIIRIKIHIDLVFDYEEKIAMKIFKKNTRLGILLSYSVKVIGVLIGLIGFAGSIATIFGVNKCIDVLKHIIDGINLFVTFNWIGLLFLLFTLIIVIIFFHLNNHC